MKRQIPKLKLNRETLRNLTASEMGNVAGGLDADTVPVGAASGQFSCAATWCTFCKSICNSCAD